MKKTVCLISLALAGMGFAGMTTPWGEKVTPENAWREYPRPQMVRANWTNLNGLWDYTITSNAGWTAVAAAKGKILVPFCFESPLSGVRRLVEPHEKMVYARTFTARRRKGYRTLINFEAVDWRTQVFVNGVEATDVPHEGGNQPFSVDVTAFIRDGENDLKVVVWDPTETYIVGGGKQNNKTEGCYYTRVSGIWQTVWMEEVPDNHVVSYWAVTDIDRGEVRFTFETTGGDQTEEIEIEVFDAEGRKVAEAEAAADEGVTVEMPEGFRLWSPDAPYLYTFKASFDDDEFTGYFGMRKVDRAKDAKGAWRFRLNNEFIFPIGTLDQGWWPDGLLTPPSLEACRHDVETLKKCGYNLIRKHVKVEPRVYYHLCDRLGILVFQDALSPAGVCNRFNDVKALHRYGMFRREWKEEIKTLRNHPCIIMWTAYNESWGQPDGEYTADTQRWTRRFDPTRLVGGPSGENDYEGGDMLTPDKRRFIRNAWPTECENPSSDVIDQHNYPGPGQCKMRKHRISLLGEFGGLGLRIPGHIWDDERAWGYGQTGKAVDKAKTQKRYLELIDKLLPLIDDGLGGAVYTQTSDIELEINGLMTYDRKVLKFDADVLRAAHRKVIERAAAAAAPATAADFRNPGREHAPQTWFHMIGGNVSREGLTADLEAVAGAGIGGIQFFHGRGGVWPRTKEQIQCLSEKWDDLVRFTAEECRRLNLVFDMQNCPGWSMCGGPWIKHDKAMRRLVCFEPDKKPAFGKDDDYREICTVEFPAPAGFGEPDHKPVSVTGEGDERVYDFGKPVTVRSMTLPNHNAMGLHGWSYQPDLTFVVSADDGTGWKTVFTRELPRAAWQDDQRLTFAVPETTAAKWKLAVRRKHGIRFPKAEFSPVARLDHWQAAAGWCFRDFKAPGSLPVFGADPGAKKVKLVFGHVNMKKKNGPAPAEATGWECDKLDPLGANAMFDAYVGRLAKGPLKGGLLNGLLLDSWECCCQNWTWKMEEYFRRMNGYELRPYLPVVFGYPVADAEKNAKFLLDWRRTLCRLVEENFYGTMAKRGRELGLKVYFETAFSDVVPGDPLRYWKYADVPMCEFWQPHDNRRGFVGSDDFKAVRACVSAAHVYGKTRVAAEALTSFALTWDENFQLFKDVADRHLFRGITHLVFHTYTHNPQTGKDFLPPGSSFGGGIGSPFLRGQTWWKFMPELTAYFARCGYMLERGKPVVDVLWMIGDDQPYRPSENAPFPAGYKYDYCNADALVTRADARDGRIVFPDGMSYTALWIPEGTFLLPETEAKIDALAKKGAKIIRGELKIDWPSQLDKLGFRPTDWYQRRDGDEDIFFVRMPNGDTAFMTVADGRKTVLDPVTGETRASWRDGLSARSDARPLVLKPAAEYPQWATERTYVGRFDRGDAGASAVLSLGKVRDWAEVYVNGRKAATLWCAPYACDIAPFLKKGANEIKVVVTSTWFNKLVRDAGLPENERTTWTIRGPDKNAKMREAGLIGPVRVFVGRQSPGRMR